MSLSAPLSRRSCLRGLGVALALPFLETMAWADPPKSGGQKRPVRLAFFYTPYGMGRGGAEPWFWPKDAASFSPSGALSPVLEGLRPVVSDCLLIGDLNNPRPDDREPGHVVEASSWLTAAGVAQDKEHRATVNLSISADQVAALQLGAYTSLPSLELGVSNCNLSGTSEAGLSAGYLNTISYRAPTQPLPSDNNPRSVFNRLFSTRHSTVKKRSGGLADTSAFAGGGGGGEEGPSLDQSMLDQVMENSASLRRHVSGADNRTLDEYLDGVRALEKRVVMIERQQAEEALERASKGKAKSGKFSDPIEVTLPSGALARGAHLQLMADLMILAFQTDLTRVVTMPFCHPYDGCAYPELGFTDDHHAATHQKEPEKHLKIDQFHITMYARILQKMRSLNDGYGTLLDNSIVMFGSGMADWSHNTANHLPTIVAGRGGGTLNPGRYIKAKGTMGDLLSAILARAGCRLDKPFGNGTKLMDLS
jgi:hypothetical protein